MQLDKISVYLKENFPKNAIEIKECLELLSVYMDSTLSDVENLYLVQHKNRNYEKIKELAGFSEEISKVQQLIEQYSETLEIDYAKDSDVDEQEAETQVKRLPNYSEYIVDSEIPYNLYDDFTHKCPAAFKFLDSKVEARQWKDVLIMTCDMLYKLDKLKFDSFLTDPSMKGRKVTYFMSNGDNMRKPVKLNLADIYVETNMSSNQIRNIITKMLKRFGFKSTDFVIFLRADYTALHG